ncbi:hypothetical protein EB796_001877 [Bugula neritina]|uniref:Uncharacterized protein n=1 Tax=Bugula neritina TaxID=10212 RepID=A0A7J7KNP9_BUGNE|nr:hypothetical protein EB796_001877 [Bugula neritina]
MMIITSGAPTASELISRNTVQITEVSQQICSNVSPYYNSTTGYVGCRLAFASESSTRGSTDLHVILVFRWSGEVSISMILERAQLVTETVEPALSSWNITSAPTLAGKESIP